MAAGSGEMGAYVAPVEEYAFLLGEAFGEDLVARASGGELSASDAVEALDGAGEFAAEVFAPLDRVLHEMLHHLDYEHFDLEETFHTEGFYKRESSLSNAIFTAAGIPPPEPKSRRARKTPSRSPRRTRS